MRQAFHTAKSFKRRSLLSTDRYEVVLCHQAHLAAARRSASAFKRAITLKKPFKMCVTSDLQWGSLSDDKLQTDNGMPSSAERPAIG
jgi:hypothetical protein